MNKFNILVLLIILTITLGFGCFPETYLANPTITAIPALHATTHENGGTDEINTGGLSGATGRTATLTVAASNSSVLSKSQADYVCDGTADNVEIQAAINALPIIGGKILLTEGTFNISANITYSTNYGSFCGYGKNTKLIASAGLGANPMLILSGFGMTLKDMDISGNGIASECVRVDYEGVINSSHTSISGLFAHLALTANIHTMGKQFITISDCFIGLQGEGAAITDYGIWTDGNGAVGSQAISINNCLIVQVTDACVYAQADWTYLTNCMVGGTSNTSYGIIVNASNFQMTGGFVEDVGKDGILITTSGLSGGLNKVTINGVSFNQIGNGAAATYSSVSLVGTNGHSAADVSIVGCNMGDAFSQILYDVTMTSYVSNVVMVGNPRMSKVNYNINNNANVVFSSNSEWKDVNTGYATITAGNTSTNVTHGIIAGSTPVSIFLNNYTDSPLPAGTYVHDNGNGTFTIYINPALGANYTFRWLAEARRN